MRRGARIYLFWFGLAAGMLAAAGIAWACTPADLVSNTSWGPSGTQITLDGYSFRQGERIDIRWNAKQQSSPDATLLATAAGPRFTVNVTIPQAEQGAYWIVASNADDGSFRAAFEYWVGDQPPSASQPGGGSNTEDSPRSDAPRRDPAPDKARQTGAGKSAAGKSPAVTPARGRTASGGAAPVTVARATSYSAAPAVTKDKASGTKVFGGSVAPSGLRHELDTPRSDGSTGAQVWDTAAERAPSLDEPVGTGPSYIALGAGLLALGIVALGGGSLVAATRRRRAEAGPRGE